MAVDTAQSPAALLRKLKSGQPYPDSQTTALAQLTRDLIISMQSQAFSSTSYAFSASPEVVAGNGVSPNRSLFAGIPATIRFGRVPTGVNGADVAHYYRIVDGATEVVLGTGGTAVSDGENLTLTFTPASNHSGTWTINTATAGIQEGIQALGPVNGRLFIPGGAQVCYAKISCAYSMSIRGAGFQVTNIVMATGFVTRAMEFNTAAGTRIDVGDFSISYTTNGTSQEAIYIKNISDGILTNFEVINGYNGVTLVSVARFIVDNFAILPRNNAFDVSSDAASTVSTVSVPTFSNGYCSMQSGVGNVFVLGPTISGMIIKAVNTALGLNAFSCVIAAGAVNEINVGPECIFDSLAGTIVNLQLSGTASASRWAIRGMCSLTVAAVNGFLLQASSTGLITGFDLDVTLVCQNAAVNGVNLQGVVGTKVKTTIVNNVAGGNAILLDAVPCTDVIISGGLNGAGSAYTPTNQMAYGVFVSAAAHNRINVLANKTYGSTALVQNNSTVGVGAVNWDTF